MRGFCDERLSFMLIGLPVGMEDHRERLRAIHLEVEAMKAARQAAGLDAFLRTLGRLPAYVQSALVGGLSLPNPISNLVCANVPGPLQPLYMMRHRMVEHCPWVPLGWRMGLAVAVMSYDTRVWFAIVADRDVPGDLDRLGTHLVECFRELDVATRVPAEFRKGGGEDEEEMLAIKEARASRIGG